jgi:hypothetical protein
LSAEEDFCPQRPEHRPARLHGLPHELLFQPLCVPFCKPLCFGKRPAARHGNASGTVGTKAQNVAPRPPIADNAQPHALSAGDQNFVVRRGGLPGSKERFELHTLI